MKEVILPERALLRSANYLLQVVAIALSYEFLARLYSGSQPGVLGASLLLCSLCCLVATVILITQQQIIGMALLAQCLVLFVGDWPATANHHHLFLMVLLLHVLLVNGVVSERRELLRLQAMLPLIVLFWSGVQKAVHGYYYQGIFLTYAITHSPRFADFFSLLLGEHAVGEIQQQALTTGVYVATSLPLLLISNTSWLLEILLPILMWLAIGRRWVVLGMIGLVLTIELAAREVAFGMYMVAALLVNYAVYLPRGSEIEKGGRLTLRLQRFWSYVCVAFLLVSFLVVELRLVSSLVP